MKQRVCLLALLATLLITSLASAQSSGWAPATLVYESPLTDQPFLTEDDSGVLHLFWTGTMRGDADDDLHRLLYAQYTQDGWSTPNDIVAMDEISVRVPSAAVDSRGTLHVVWGGEGLHYSAAPSWEAGSAASWSEPLNIGTGGVINSPIGFQIGPDDTLHVIAASYEADVREVFYIYSADMGDTWQAPRRISSTPQGAATDVASLGIDSEGTLHAVWSRVESPTGYPPVGVYYSFSADNGQTWTAEQPLAGLDYGEPFLAVDRDDTVHVAYNGRVGVGGKYHRSLRKGASAWSGITTLVPAGRDGLNSPPKLIADAAGIVHFVAGGDTSVYMATWNGSEWSTIANLRDTVVGALEETERTTVQIVAGNQLHTVFENHKKQLWHTWRALDAAAVPPVNYQAVHATEAAPEVAAVEIRAPRDPFLAEPTERPDPTPTVPTNQNVSILLGTAAALMLLALAVVVQQLKLRVL